MNQLIDNIFKELKEEHSISKSEVEYIVDSQFKLTTILMGDRKNLKDIKWMYLGEIRPSDFIQHKRRRDEYLAKKIEGNNSGLG